MSGYEIGISGIHAAQLALDIVGNNLANAATEGYHRQEADLRPLGEVYTQGHLIGQGVSVAGIKRMVNELLDEEIVTQESRLSQLDKELEALMTMESAFAELSTSALSTSMDEFFNSMHSLAGTPDDVNLQSLVISGAQSLSTQLRNLGTIMRDVEDLSYSEAETTVDSINMLAGQIAGMNKQIHDLTVRGKDCTNLLDQRGQLITDLGKLVGIQTFQKEQGVVDVVVGDTTLVLGAITTDLEVGLVANGDNYDMGVGPAGQGIYNTHITGGRLGGLLTIRNEIVRDAAQELDTLARTIITETNKLHVQGVGTAGSFSRLTGWTMTETDVGNFVPPVTAGTIHIRVTDSSGNVSRHQVAVDPATSTLSSVAADIAAIPGLDLHTTVNAGRLQIVANAGYSFDFLPGSMAEPSGYPSGALAGAGGGANQLPPVISIRGEYTGAANQTFTCTVNTVPPASTFAIGSGDMVLEVKDGLGVSVATVAIGEGYQMGSMIDIGNGLKVSFGTNGASPGYLNDGEDFEIEALANSDTSGFLAAAGINTFFSGVDATSISVASHVANAGGRIAVSRSVNGEASRNALRMAQLGDQALSSLDGLTPKAYYRNLATDIGAQISTRKMQQENAHGVWRNLSEQRSDISGVDMNDEAAKMLVFERMFQAMAKYMNTLNESMDTLLALAQ